MQMKFVKSRNNQDFSCRYEFFVYLCTMMIYKTETWEFYTETKEGVETIVATKTLKYPKKSSVWKTLRKQGFTDTVHRYGFRIKFEFRK